MNNQSQPSFTQYPSADPTKGIGIKGPEPLYWLQDPLSPSTPANPARQILICMTRRVETDPLYDHIVSDVINFETVLVELFLLGPERQTEPG
jgi:hypothetical protein